MALINNNYVFVKDESVSRGVDSTSYAVEKGIDLTDHVHRKPIELSISGSIVNHNMVEAYTIVNNLTKLYESGSLVTYVGRNELKNMQIQSFDTSHPNTVWGGCEFDMTLKEVRIAKPAYTAPKPAAEKPKSTGTKQVEKGDTKNVYHTVKKGDTLWKLVTTTYKDLEPKYSKVMDKCKWIMDNSPDAFSRKGDYGTMQIGGKLLVGYRK